MTLVVATPPGGPYDIYARLLARHLGEHIPGHPTILVENMSGATGMRAAQYLYAVAPQDGTVIGNLHNMIALIEALGRRSAARNLSTSIGRSPHPAAERTRLAEWLRGATRIVARRALVRCAERRLKRCRRPTRWRRRPIWSG